MAFLWGCVAAYFEPIHFIAYLTVLLFTMDWITGVTKSVMVTKTFKLKSKKWRWSFVKAFVYLGLMFLTFLVSREMGISDEQSREVTKILMWCVIYVEGLSVVENLRYFWPNDKFLKFLHYMLSVEFLKFIPWLSRFFKEQEQEVTENDCKNNKTE